MAVASSWLLTQKQRRTWLQFWLTIVWALIMSSSTNQIFQDLDNGLGDELFDLFLNTDLLDHRSLREITEDDLYQERLQSLIDSQLRDIQTFATKEGKNFAEVECLIFAFKDL